MLSNSLKMIHIDRNMQELRQIVFKSIILALVRLLVLLCELFVNINVIFNITLMLNVNTMLMLNVNIMLMLI